VLAGEVTPSPSPTWAQHCANETCVCPVQMVRVMANHSALSSSVLKSENHVRVVMEIVGQAFGLGIKVRKRPVLVGILSTDDLASQAETIEIISGATEIYKRWLLGDERCIPPPIREDFDDQQVFFCVTTDHSLNQSFFFKLLELILLLPPPTGNVQPLLASIPTSAWRRRPEGRNRRELPEPPRAPLRERSRHLCHGGQRVTIEGRHMGARPESSPGHH